MGTQRTIPDTEFRRACAAVFRRYGRAFDALARSDERPAHTDPCCDSDGACDGSCGSPRA